MSIEYLQKWLHPCDPSTSDTDIATVLPVAITKWGHPVSVSLVPEYRRLNEPRLRSHESTIDFDGAAQTSSEV